jgi:hypothetical protein
MRFSRHNQSLVYLGELDLIHTPLILSLYDGFLLFHQEIEVDGVMYSQGYITLPKACFLHASEILKQEWDNSSVIFKERRIKYERELAVYLINYQPSHFFSFETDRNYSRSCL